MTYFRTADNGRGINLKKTLLWNGKTYARKYKVIQSDVVGAVYILVAKVHDWEPESWWSKPQCGHNKINAAVGPPRKALNPALLQGGLAPA